MFNHDEREMVKTMPWNQTLLRCAKLLLSLFLLLCLVAGCVDDGRLATGPSSTERPYDAGLDDVSDIDELPERDDARSSDNNVAYPDYPDEDVPTLPHEDDPIVSPPDGPDLPPDSDTPSESEHVGTPCTVNQVAGVCLHINDCSGDYVSTPGHCPGPAEIQCCTQRPSTSPTPSNPSSSCDPDDRVLPNEGLVEEPGTGGCPAGMALVEDFCIDRFEASLVEILPDGTEQGWSPYFNPGTANVRAVSLRNAVPQGYINGHQAASACANAGKRLCTNTEWLRACQGPSQYTFPYGETLEPGRCNDERSQHPAVEYFGTGADWIWSQLGHPCINQLHDSLHLTGENQSCTSAEGIYDMMGNLHEWTSDASGIFRGGFYADTYRNGPGCLYRTTAHTLPHWDYSTGFRCCADVP